MGSGQVTICLLYNFRFAAKEESPSGIFIQPPHAGLPVKAIGFNICKPRRFQRWPYDSGTMAFLIKNKIMTVPAIIYQAENSGIEVGGVCGGAIRTTYHTDMVILNDGEIATPLIKIACFRIQVKHEKTAAAESSVGGIEDRTQFSGRHNVIKTVKDRDYGMVFLR